MVNKNHSLLLTLVCLAYPAYAGINSPHSPNPDSIVLLQRFMRTQAGPELNSYVGFDLLGKLDRNADVSQRVLEAMTRHLPDNFSGDLSAVLEGGNHARLTRIRETIKKAYLQAGTDITEQAQAKVKAYDSGQMSIYEFTQAFQELRPFLLYSPYAAGLMTSRIEQSALQDAFAAASQFVSQGDILARADEWLRPVSQEEMQRIFPHVSGLRRMGKFEHFPPNLNRLKGKSIQPSYLAPVARILPQALAVRPHANPLPWAISQAREEGLALMRGFQSLAMSYVFSSDSSMKGISEMASFLSRMRRTENALKIYFSAQELHKFDQAVSALKATVRYRRGHSESKP